MLKFMKNNQKYIRRDFDNFRRQLQKYKELMNCNINLQSFLKINLTNKSVRKLIIRH